MAISRYRSRPEGWWTYTWTPGAALEHFFSLYDYCDLADINGDLVISTPMSVPTTLDGPIVVSKFRDLTVNAKFTQASRSRGWMPLWRALHIGSGGSISMTGRGAKGDASWPVRDLFVPAAITFTGRDTSLYQFLRWIRDTNYCLFDPILYVDRLPGLGDIQCDWSTWTPYGSLIISAAGCGLGATYAYRAASNSGTTTGITGAAGSNAPGGGGSGAANVSGSSEGQSMPARPGYPWGGGVGSAGGNQNYRGYFFSGPGDDFGGRGGTCKTELVGAGAGNPAGDNSVSGTGGILVGLGESATIDSGGVYEADGLSGTGTGAVGGGGSGAGKASLCTIAPAVVNGTIRANGGASVASGGAGGAGSAEAKTFAQMGWA